MSAVAIDPVAELEKAGEGRFEFAGGRLIEMAPPSDDHSEAMGFLYALMRAFAESRGAGRVKPDTYAQRLGPGTIRVPDVAFFRKENVHRIGPKLAEGASDLVVEIVSPESRVRDRRDKLFDYAQAGVEEYWIVDPLRRTADFYRLVEGVYERVLPDAEGRLHSSTLPGFFVRVDWLWNAPTLIEAMRELGLM